MPATYFEVLTNDRAATDRDLQRAEHRIQAQFGDVVAELGLDVSLPSPVKVEVPKSQVLVTAPLVNARSGPGMSYEPIKQLKKDDLLEFLSEQGEWYQVHLSSTRTGWVHRNVASKRQPGEVASDEAKRVEAKVSGPESRPALRLEPIDLASTPLEFIPHPTSDEVRIYLEVEQQLRDLQPSRMGEPKHIEQRSLQRMSEKHGLTPTQIWNTYLKVQGWEMKP
jgi:hypothetical protein